MTVRTLQKDEWDEVAELIFRSTNEWYLSNLNRVCFAGDDSSVCRVFPETYEALDPGCCLVVEIEGKLAASCFYHPRERHVSLGIMNVGGEFSGRGFAGILLDEMISRAGTKPLRLISSALNLDSYSLYTRAGFRPVAVYQDMYFPSGKSLPPAGPGVRVAEIGDLADIVALDRELGGLERAGDFRHFLADEAGIWSGFVREASEGISGFLFAVNHPGSRIVGPGAMRDSGDALELIAAALTTYAEDESPIFLIPAARNDLVRELYQAGARNCELHVTQVRGEVIETPGIMMPTFLPETG